MYLLVLLHTIGALVFLFIFWKKLREDYSSQMVFTAGFLVLLGITVGLLVSKYILPGWWFWTALVGIFGVVIYSKYKNKFKTNEIVDAVISGLLPWLALTFFADSVVNKSIFSLGGFFILLAIYIFYKYIDARYKRYTWYRSGKVGFSTLTAAAILFLLRALAGLAVGDMLSFIGKGDIILSAVLSFVLFLSIYNLGKQ